MVAIEGNAPTEQCGEPKHSLRFGTGKMTPRGFGTVLLQLNLYIGVSRFFWTVCKLESDLESRSSDSGA